MEILQLRAFIAVAEELHFGRAAERLHVAQPPLSRTIQQLEKELGVRLFERTTRRVELTSAGDALIAPARDILDYCRVAESAVKAAGVGETGRVRIGFAGPSSHMLIGRLARQVLRLHPGIELSLSSVTYGYEALSHVIEGTMDLAIVRWPGPHPGIASRVVQKEHYVLVVPADHPLAGKPIVRVSDLAEESFVSLPAEPGSTVRDAFIRLCHEAGFAPDIVQVAPDSWTVMALVAAEVGVTISVDSAVENISHGEIRAIPLKEGLEATYAQLVWREGDDNPALREVLHVADNVLPTPPAGPTSEHSSPKTSKGG